MNTLSRDSSPRRSAGMRLSMMMFLQYAVWGVWLPYLANYLQAPVAVGGLEFSPVQIGWILGLAGSIGALAAPFLAGQIADRFMNAEIYLGLLLIGGGVVKIATYYAHDYSTFLALSIVYSVAYMPTLALTNSIAFANLDRPEQKFPLVRVWGTIGWIVASNAFPLLWLQSSIHLTSLPPFLEGVDKPDQVRLIGDCLRVSGVVSILYGFWAMLALPRTPPVRSAEHPLAFIQAFSLLRHGSVLVCMIAALIISMIHQVYFIRTGPFLAALGFNQKHVGPIMSVGQIAEIAVLGALGLLLARLGYKRTLVLGCLAYAVRYAIFATALPETRGMVIAAMVLHGVCYACFFAASYLYIERMAMPSIRHSAQTVYGIIIIGIGPVLAGAYNQWIEQLATAPGQPFDWSRLWWIQAAMGGGAALFMMIAFRAGIEVRARESAVAS